MSTNTAKILQHSMHRSLWSDGKVKRVQLQEKESNASEDKFYERGDISATFVGKNDFHESMEDPQPLCGYGLKKPHQRITSGCR